MKKVNMLKKILSFGLALALFLTSPASVYAAQVEESTVEAVSENKEEAAAETPATDSGEEKSESDIPSEDKDDSASLDNPAEGTEVNNEDQSIIDKVVDTVEDLLGLNDDEKSEDDEAEDAGEEEAEEEDEDEQVEPLSDVNGYVTITGTKKALGHVASVSAVEITESSDVAQYDEMAEALDEKTGDNTSVVDFVAYDVTLFDADGNETEPNGEINVVFNKVNVEGLNDSNYSTEIYHYDDSALNEVAVKSESNNSVEMAVDHFSKYLIAITGAANKNQFFLESDYVEVSSQDADFSSTELISNVGKNIRTISITVHVDDKTIIYPADNKVFRTANDKAILNIKPADGYAIEKVTANEIYKNLDNRNDFKDKDGGKEKSEQIEGALRSVTNSTTKQVKIGIGKSDEKNRVIKYVPATQVHIYLKKDIVTISQARFVKFARYYTYSMADLADGSGKGFTFSSGGTDHNFAGDNVQGTAQNGYKGIYAGLASNTIYGYNFNLNKNVFSSQEEFFPDDISTCVAQEGWNDNYARDGAVYNANVEFVKEGNYYVLDSDKYSYALVDGNGNNVEVSKTYTSGTLKITSNTGSTFKPIQGQCHFGMILPMDFTITENGKTGNSNTVFEFEGDDDVFVYIDGKLVLDLGGIHSKVKGSIDFCTGEVKANGSKVSNIYEGTTRKTYANSTHHLTIVYFERGDNESNCRIKFNYVPTEATIIPEPEEFKKTITVEKTWDDNNSASRPESVAFDVYGTFGEGANKVYVTADGTTTSTETAFGQITVTKDNASASNANIWTTTTGKDYPVFVDNDKSKVIVWEVRERTAAGYEAIYADKTEFDESTSVITENQFTLPAVEQTAGEGRYNHIDIELWSAQEQGQTTSATIDKIKDYYDHEDQITVVGFYTSGSYNNWSKTEKNIKLSKNQAATEYSTGVNNGVIYASKNTKIVFKVKYESSNEYKLVSLNKDSVYPQGTVILNPHEYTYNNFGRICDYLGVNRNSESVDVSGENIYAISAASCYGGTGNPGLDLVLTPATIAQYTVTNGTGNETHKVTNTKSTVSLKLSKVVSDGTTVDPDSNAKYQFKIEKVVVGENEQTSYELVKNGDKEVFELKNGESVTVENLDAGDYRVTEIGIANSGHNYTLSNYDTRVVEITTKDNKKQKTEKANFNYNSEEARAVELKLDKDVTEIEFENLKYTEETTDIKATNRKYISKVNEGGTFDLTLDFTAPGKEVSATKTVPTDKNTDSPKYDIVVVFDTSSSVDKNELEQGQAAIKKMLKAAENNENIRWKLVEFNNSASVLNDDWKTSSLFGGTVDTLTIGDGRATNYEAALKAAKTAIGTADSKAQKVIIFITDGEPTYCNNHDAEETYNYGTYSTGWEVTNQTYGYALAVAKEINCNDFYSIGINLDNKDSLKHDWYYYNNGHNWVDEFTYDLTQQGIVENIANSVVKATTRATYTCDSFATVGEELTKVVGGIVTDYASVPQTTTKTFATTATITDVLSEYAEFAEEKVTYTYKVTGSDGLDVANPSYTATPSFDADTRTLTVAFTAPANADLKDYKYSVTFKIKPTDKAYEDFAKNGDAYPANVVGEEGTGDSSYDEANKVGKPGFFSNDSAKVVFSNNDELPYNKPVIQIKNIFDWQLVKVSASQPDTKLRDAEFLLQSTADKNVKFTGTSDGDGKVTWSDFIPAGTYTLTETKAPKGYSKTNEVWTVVVDRASEVTVTDSGNNKVSVVVDNGTALNSGVTKKVATLTITNNVAYVLPETGGRGVYVYTIGGVLLMLGASLLLYKNKKNKNK